MFGLDVLLQGLQLLQANSQRFPSSRGHQGSSQSLHELWGYGGVVKQQSNGGFRHTLSKQYETVRISTNQYETRWKLMVVKFVKPFMIDIHDSFSMAMITRG